MQKMEIYIFEETSSQWRGDQFKEPITGAGTARSVGLVEFPGMSFNLVLQEVTLPSVG